MQGGRGIGSFMGGLDSTSKMVSMIASDKQLVNWVSILIDPPASSYLSIEEEFSLAPME